MQANVPQAHLSMSLLRARAPYGRIELNKEKKRWQNQSRPKKPPTA